MRELRHIRRARERREARRARKKKVVSVILSPFQTLLMQMGAERLGLPTQ
jgi:hypothetical protein